MSALAVHPVPGQEGVESTPPASQPGVPGRDGADAGSEIASRGGTADEPVRERMARQRGVAAGAAGGFGGARVGGAGDSDGAASGPGGNAAGTSGDAASSRPAWHAVRSYVARQPVVIVGGMPGMRSRSACHVRAWDAGPP